MKKHINHKIYDQHMPDNDGSMRMAIYIEYRVVNGKLKMTTVTRQYHATGYTDSESTAVICDAE
jgi:hypothetical protein